ncbi:hypothetical protein SGPA1_21983 [Streptomyces misionensis JCM 4497]
MVTAAGSQPRRGGHRLRRRPAERRRQPRAGTGLQPPQQPDVLQDQHQVRHPQTRDRRRRRGVHAGRLVLRPHQQRGEAGQLGTAVADQLTGRRAVLGLPGRRRPGGGGLAAHRRRGQPGTLPRRARRPRTIGGPARHVHRPALHRRHPWRLPARDARGARGPQRRRPDVQSRLRRARRRGRLVRTVPVRLTAHLGRARVRHPPHVPRPRRHVLRPGRHQPGSQRHRAGDQHLRHHAAVRGGLPLRHVRSGPLRHHALRLLRRAHRPAHRPVLLVAVPAVVERLPGLRGIPGPGRYDRLRRRSTHRRLADRRPPRPYEHRIHETGHRHQPGRDQLRRRPGRGHPAELLLPAPGVLHRPDGTRQRQQRVVVRTGQRRRLPVQRDLHRQRGIDDVLAGLLRQRPPVEHERKREPADAGPCLHQGIQRSTDRLPHPMSKEPPCTASAMPVGAAGSAVGLSRGYRSRTTSVVGRLQQTRAVPSSGSSRGGVV